MAGTREGGLKAARTLRKEYGAGFYAKIGKKGGQVEVSKGFSTNKPLARLAGQKGGRIKRVK